MNSSHFAFRSRPLPERKLEVAAIPSSFNIGVPWAPNSAKQVTAGVPDKAAHTSTPQSAQTPKTHNDIDNVAMALEHKVRVQPGGETLGLPITKTTLEQKSATPILADGPGENASAQPASSVRRATRKQKSVIPVPNGDPGKAVSTKPTPMAHSNKSVPVAYRFKPRAPASNGDAVVVKVSPVAKSVGSLVPDSYKIKVTAPASPPKVSLGSSDGLASRSSPTFKDTIIDSTPDISSRGPVSTSSPLALPAAALTPPPTGSLDSSDGSASTSSPALSDERFALNVQLRAHRASLSAPKESLLATNSLIDSLENTALGTFSNTSLASSHRLSSPPSLALNGDAPTTPSSVNCESSGGLPSTHPLALKDTSPASPSDANPNPSDDIVSTLSPARALPLGVDVEESSSTDPQRADAFRLFDLPQELQDLIFELAYTEPSFKLVSKPMWDLLQTETRRSTGKPKVDFPTHKVNEWMVSKKYFRAAAKAWVGTQTTFELVRDRVTLSISETDMREKFPSIDGAAAFGLFFEFGKTFPVELSFRPGWPEHDYANIPLCRRIRGLIFIVSEEHFDVIDRGLAWEVEFTDEELMSMLELLIFTLLSKVEKLEMLPEDLRGYVDIDAKRAIFASNVENLRRLMWQHRSMEVQADSADGDHGLLYLGSEVSFSAPSGAYTDGKRASETLRSLIAKLGLAHILTATTANTLQPRNGPHADVPVHQPPPPQVMSNPQDTIPAASPLRKRKAKARSAKQTDKPHRGASQGLVLELFKLACVIALAWFVVYVYLRWAKHAEFVAANRMCWYP